MPTIRFITNWRALKVGQHIRLLCGCEGFVYRVDLDGEFDDKSDVGFVVTYTIEGCVTRRSQEKVYQEGYGPYRNYFNYTLSDSAMPAVETPVPEWWPEVAKLRGWKEGM